MARIKKEEKKSSLLMLVLVGIMVFGTLAGGLLFQNPQPEEQPLLTTPPPTTQPETSMIIRHNPVNTTVLTVNGYQTISYSDTHIFRDSNHPLADKTLTFDIWVKNITRSNYTGASDTMTIEKGDTIEVDYTGRLEGGEIFDTSYPEIAGNASVSKVPWFTERPSYEPLEFVVGAGMMIKGFDEAVVGMKINEAKNAEIPPESAYGHSDPSQIEAVPILQKVEKTMELRKKWETYTQEEFQGYFGNVNMTQGETFNVPGSNFNASIEYVAGNMTIVEMLLKEGDVVRFYDYPWNSTVTSVTPGYIYLEHDMESGDVVQFSGMPWNTTVL